MRRLVAELHPDVAHLHNIYHQLTPSIIEALQTAGVPVVMPLHDYKLVCPSYGLFSRGRFCYRCRGGRFYHAAIEACSGGSRLRSALLSVESYYQKYSGVYEGIARFTASQPLHAPGPSSTRATTPIASSTSLRSFPRSPTPRPHPTISPPAFPTGSRSISAGSARRRGLTPFWPPPQPIPGSRWSSAGMVRNANSCRRKRTRGGSTGYTLRGMPTGARCRRSSGRAAVAMLPTLSPENAPFSALEAAVAGVPLVVSNMGGLPEIAELSGGRVVPVGEGAALAEAVRDIWQAPSDSTAQAGSDRIRAHYDRDTHMSRLENIYREAIDARRAA